MAHEGGEDLQVQAPCPAPQPLLHHPPEEEVGEEENPPRPQGGEAQKGLPGRGPRLGGVGGYRGHPGFLLYEPGEGRPFRVRPRVGAPPQDQDRPVLGRGPPAPKPLRPEGHQGGVGAEGAGEEEAGLGVPDPGRLQSEGQVGLQVPRPEEEEGKDHSPSPPCKLQGTFQEGGALVLDEAQKHLLPEPPFQSLPEPLGQGLGPRVGGAVGGEEDHGRASSGIPRDRTPRARVRFPRFVFSTRSLAPSAKTAASATPHSPVWRKTASEGLGILWAFKTSLG